jgi:hypothetical protein
MVLACAAGGSNTAVAARLGDEPRPGVPRTITDAQVEEGHRR